MESFKGTVQDAGGGFVSILVDRGTEHYPEVGDKVWVSSDVEIELFGSIPTIPTQAVLHEIHLDFTPEPYSRYRERTHGLGWDCKGCGSVVSDRDQHEVWHDLITRMVTSLTRR